MYKPLLAGVDADIVVDAMARPITRHKISPKQDIYYSC